MTTSATVSINGSQITGTERNGVRAFLGVPYALPPTKEYRFTKPRPLPKDYHYPTDCTNYGPACPQPQYYLNSNPIQKVPQHIKVSEDCLYLNIWTPTGPPNSKWPVMTWFHGGWLQVGNAHESPDQLIQKMNCIVVSVGYRLNCFGFLAASGCQGNFGLWDQRTALEWVSSNIASFGGDSGNVTIAGLSAGANSVHHQLHYEFFQSRGDPIFHRAVMYSNSVSAQPRRPDQADEQFAELCAAFDITGSFEQRLKGLREIKDTELAGKLMDLKYHTFRHVTDDEFVSSELSARSARFKFAAEFKRRGFKLIIGEVENEDRTYRGVNPPTSKDDVLVQLQNYYSPETSARLLHLRPFTGTDSDPEHWKDLFGEIVAACQVHASERLFVSQLLHPSTGLTTSDVMRYRISKRLAFYDAAGVPEEMGVAHGFCQPIWWYQKDKFHPDEVAAIDQWLEPWKAFIHGEPVTWGTTKMKQYRSFNSDGTIDIRDDVWWDHFQPIAKVLMPRESKI